MRFHQCAAQCRTLYWTNVCAGGNGQANNNKLCANIWEKCAHICEHVCAYSTSRRIHSDAQDYFVRALSLASATGAKTFFCTCTMGWTNDKVFKFIQAVDIHPALWNTINKDYNKKHDAKKDLGEEFSYDWLSDPGDLLLDLLKHFKSIHLVFLTLVSPNNWALLFFSFW